MRSISRLGSGITVLGLCLMVGCTSLPRPVSLPIDEQRRIETIDHFVQTFFTQEARDSLKASALYVARHGPLEALGGNTPEGTYLNYNRHVDIVAYKRARDVEDIIFHESIHYLCDVGLIDRDRFKAAYNKINEPGYEQVKEELERIIKGYDPNKSDIVEEQIAYAAELWKLAGYDIPERMKQVFDRTIIRPQRGFIRGLVGKRLR
ncbi:hypothetical protein JXB31_01910 [Candidatus Woesearchaeota archaeon]|nr:hypothetical protein [Candidatus Woesearchaeota archaeon]